MQKVIITMCLNLIWFSGCGSQAGSIGAGIAAGAFGSRILLGAKEDLIQLETSLQGQYAEALANQDVEKMERLELAILRTQTARKSIEAGEKFLGIDWKDPEAVGTASSGALALLLSLLYGNKIRKKYKATNRGTEKFSREHSTELAKELYEDIGLERTKLKV